MHNEQDLKNTPEYRSGMFRIVTCPVCGYPTLDMYWICEHCGWEYDIELQTEDEESPCNGMSLRAYRELYKIGGISMNVSICSRKAAEELLRTDTLSRTAVISFCDPPSVGKPAPTPPLDYAGKAARVFTVAVHDLDLTALPDVGLDCDKYAMPERSREVVRNELDIPQDAVVLLSVGTLRMQKRLRVILQAMARLRNREQLHYVICGEGPDMPFLQKLTRQLHLEERVHLLGYRTDIPDMLGAADIFCMPSRREGCGMAALEAMAAGLPLITVRSHGTKTYAEKGESGFCLKGDLVTSCADAIEQLADNKLLRRQMGARNRAAATAFSDADRMMLLRGYYQKALGD